MLLCQRSRENQGRSYKVRPSGNKGIERKQWAERIRVLLVAIPLTYHLEQKKETPNEQVSVHY